MFVETTRATNSMDVSTGYPTTYTQTVIIGDELIISVETSSPHTHSSHLLGLSRNTMDFRRGILAP